MRLALILAMLGLLLGVARAQTRDLAAEPAYPSAQEATAAPRAKSRTRPAVKPAAAKPAAPKPAEVKLPAPKPVEVKLPAPKPEPRADKPEPKLSADAERTLRDEFGWAVVVDPATGIRLGIPGKLAPQTREAKSGTRWASRHGDVVIETFRIKTGESLSVLFEAQKKEPATRKIESSSARPDGFFVSGLQGLKQFAVRAQMKDGELRGYTMLYDQAMAGIVLPVLPAMANAFAPFPSVMTPIATLSPPVAYGSGVIVSADGHILTDRRFADDCNVIAIPPLGNAERVAIDQQHGLALLRVYGKRKLEPAALASEPPSSADLTLVGVSDPHIQNGGKERTELKAKLAGGNALELRQSVPVAGLSGAPAFDAQGRVLGLMEMRTMQLASTQPAAPPVRLVPASTVRDFLTAHRVALAQEPGAAKAAVVRVICVRH